MCGRYLLTTPAEALRQLFDFIEQPNLGPRYNIAPTSVAPVIRQRREPKGERTLAPLRWGLVPVWAESVSLGAPLINARAETLTEKPAFRTAFRRRRCLVPADGFYEWKEEGGTTRQPYVISRIDSAPIAFAGLWERWMDKAKNQPLDSFTIITTSANDLLRPLHERMPVILAPESWARWLDPESEAAPLTALLVPAPNEGLRYAPVDRRVNSVRNDAPDLLRPVGPEVRF
ncbi:MAG TPA: SOS response-associated peptidase [Stellaceae bacterium]|nr:SOS response-associated peptidase [Stellaceae bacterium]